MLSIVTLGFIVRARRQDQKSVHQNRAASKIKQEWICTYSFGDKALGISVECYTLAEYSIRVLPYQYSSDVYVASRTA